MSRRESEQGRGSFFYSWEINHSNNQKQKEFHACVSVPRCCLLFAVLFCFFGLTFTRFLPFLPRTHPTSTRFFLLLFFTDALLVGRGGGGWWWPRPGAHPVGVHGGVVGLLWWVGGWVDGMSEMIDTRGRKEGKGGCMHTKEELLVIGSAHLVVRYNLYD